MKLPFSRQHPAEQGAGQAVSTGPQCSRGCYDIALDAKGLVKDHTAWYPGGRRKCYGSGEPTKGGAR